jgi:phospholipid/cholesterol/gamma-HCH transport system substrate-binding protein
MRRFRRLRGDAIPLGRFTIALQLLTAIVVGGYLVTRFHSDIPLIAPQYQVNVVLSDAAGLNPSHRPQVLIAGVPSGYVTGVHYSPARGQSVATLSLDENTKRLLHTDARVQIYPRSALQDLVLDITPGRSTAPVLRPGATLSAAAATIPVGYDEVTGVFDADTRAYTQILIDTLAQLLQNRPGPLRLAIRRLPALTASATTIARELATRRQLLSQLVGQLAQITNATGRRGTQLVEAIRAAKATLQTTAARTTRVEQTVQRLPPTLTQATSTFGAVQRLAGPLIPALDGLRPTADALPRGLRATRRLLPSVNGLLDDLEPLVTRGRAPLDALHSTATELGPVARGTARIVPTVQKYVDTLDADQQYVKNLVNQWPSAISVNSANGAETRALFLGEDGPYPQLFGLPSNSTKSLTGDRRFLAQLQSLLGFTCLKLNRTACYLLPSILGKVLATK